MVDSPPVLSKNVLVSFSKKVNINHIKLSLQLKVEVERIDRRSCEMCLRDSNEDEIYLLDSLEELEELLSKETDPSLLYIADYAQKCQNIEYEDTFSYYKLYSEHTNTLIRGGHVIHFYFVLSNTFLKSHTIFSPPTRSQEIGRKALRLS